MGQSLGSGVDAMNGEAANLAARYAAFREEHPKVRIRDAAQRLGVSEVALVATGCGGASTRLDGDWQRLVGELHRLGPLMALTRNEHAVHEKTGTYGRLSHSGSVGTLLGAIDLRLLFSRWQHGFAVREKSAHGVRESLQFFDQVGTAVHKVYLTDDSDRGAYRDLVASFRGADQGIDQAILRRPPRTPTVDDDQVDVGDLQAHWRALQDTHDFNDLLTRFGVARLQALRLVDDELAAPVGSNAVRRVLQWVAERRVPIMLFVASPGAVQIHTGPVTNLVSLGPWFNVLDETFSLHLRETAIATSYVVRKPTRDGVVSSLEAFDADGDLVCQLFGRRKPGQAENPAWREALEAAFTGVDPS
jgi:putative hemin transport protein